MLMPMSNDKVGKPLRMNGVALTQSGRELFKIVKVEPVDKYSQGLAHFFEKQGFQMVEVGDGEPRVVRINAAAESDSQ